MKRFNSQTGFTLVELIMTIVILSIISVIAIPIYTDSRQEARNASELGVAGGVRGAIMSFFLDPARGNRTLFPSNAEVDPGPVGACTSASPCFEGILGQGGIQAEWTKVTANTWTSSAGGGTWTYTQTGPNPGTSDDGTFLKA